MQHCFSTAWNWRFRSAAARLPGLVAPINAEHRARRYGKVGKRQDLSFLLLRALRACLSFGPVCVRTRTGRRRQVLRGAMLPHTSQKYPSRSFATLGQERAVQYLWMTTDILRFSVHPLVYIAQAVRNFTN